MLIIILFKLIQFLIFFPIFIFSFSCNILTKEKLIEPIKIKTSLGFIEGRRHCINNNNNLNNNNEYKLIDIFFGIPYALPPIGKLRFEKPKLLNKWEGIKLAIEPPPACIYHSWPEGFDKKEKNYSEDCLYMNIFAPKIKKNPIQLYPILFIIHGGGFEVGSSHQFHNFTEIGNKFVSQGIIVISINYRLGWIGFGSNRDNNMPGNLGLWDMIEALKFINKNIKYFGGDPNKITIYGYSAGGASVSLLSVSPYSKGLFKQCIQMSGSPLAAWALNERTINETINLANTLGCLDKKLIKNCLTKKSISDIWNAVDKIGTTRIDDINFSRWSPRIDGDFLPKDFPELIKNSEPKKTLMGFTDLETLYWTLFIGRNISLAAYAIPWEEINNFDFTQFKYKVNNIIAKNEFFGEKIAKELSKEIIEFYLNNNEPLNEFNYFENTKTSLYYLQKYTLLLSDIQFIISIIKDSQLKIKNGWPIYLYYNLHYNPKEFPEQVKIHQNFHTNDENLLFRNFPTDFTLSEEDLIVEQFLTQFFINFIKFGNPSINGIKWYKATNKLQTRHMRINSEPKLEKHFDSDLIARQEFFQKILNKYGNIWDLIRGGNIPLIN